MLSSLVLDTGRRRRAIPPRAVSLLARTSSFSGGHFRLACADMPLSSADLARARTPKGPGGRANETGRPLAPRLLRSADLSVHHGCSAATIGAVGDAVSAGAGREPRATKALTTTCWLGSRPRARPCPVLRRPPTPSWRGTDRDRRQWAVGS
jgi:hypothetical protein